MDTTLYKSEIETKYILKKIGVFGAATAFVNNNSYEDPLSDRKIELATERLEPFHATKLFLLHPGPSIQLSDEFFLL